MRRDPQLGFLLAQLGATGEGAPGLEEKLHLLAAFRGQSPAGVEKVDHALVEELERLRAGLGAAQETQEQLKALLDKLTSPPQHPAIFLGAADTDTGPAAMVLHGGARRVVSIGDEVDAGSMVIGDEVLLANELNVLVSKSPYDLLHCGETAFFERYTQGGSLVLRSRDEEIVVTPARGLRSERLKAGDEVRFDRTGWLAFEKIDRSEGSQLFLESTPSQSFADIGGLDREVEQLQRSIRLHFEHAETVRKYRLQRKKAVLVWGPPGTGKTLLARALSNWMAGLSPAGRSHFINVKPGGLNSMWFGQTEANYREVFRVAREAGEREPDVPVVVFFDEVDSVGTVRGESVHRIDDRVLNAFMAELNGLEDRGNVVVVTATNRLDALDPALVRPGRLGDLVIHIPRPGRTAAREIFAKHLHSDVPYAANGHDAAATRAMIIDSAVSRIYSSGGDSDLATIMFRDSKRRTIRASDLINGAEIARVAQSAVEQACLREAEGGAPGVQLADVLAGISEFIETASLRLTPANCRKYLDDLPQDVEVVRVEPLERKVPRPHRYLNVA